LGLLGGTLAKADALAFLSRYRDLTFRQTISPAPLTQVSCELAEYTENWEIFGQK
jgi:hypothetical protein